MILIVVSSVSNIFFGERSVPWCHHPMLDVTFLKGKEICYSYIVANTCSWDGSVSYWNLQLSQSKLIGILCIASNVVHVAVFGDPVLQISFGALIACIAAISFKLEFAHILCTIACGFGLVLDASHEKIWVFRECNRNESRMARFRPIILQGTSNL